MKTVHWTVFKGYRAAQCNEGERSCPLPLGMTVVIPHPLHRFERMRLRARGGDFALCGARPKGSSPFGNLASWAQLD
ncbi:MAG: hypothetical protein K2J72_03110, partial [Oscillospiraceae bacterium]|nr:hypothetical protein [Oscillospiraceae bacterium]